MKIPRKHGASGGYTNQLPDDSGLAAIETVAGAAEGSKRTGEDFGLRIICALIAAQIWGELFFGTDDRIVMIAGLADGSLGVGGEVHDA